MSTPSAKLNPVTLCLPLGLLPLFLLAGCAGTKVVPVSPLTTLNLQGVVQGGQQPVTDSKLQLYATGTTGDGSTSTALLSQPFQTGSNGEFTISGAYTCPSATSQVYVVATGGNPGLSSGSSNSSIALMATLGPCGNLSSVPFTTVNEVTTVGSIWPLAPYGKSVAQIGSGNSDAQAFDAAAASINQLISVANGTAPGPMLPAGDVAPTDKLYTLASIIAACVNSTGGSAGDGSACGQLFCSAASGGVPPPSDTIAAALAIAQNPNRNVVDIFDLSPMNGAFQPILSSPPADWTLPILAIPAAPTISPDTGTLASGQTVSIAEATLGAAVYYTTDGSAPSEASQTYSGPIALTNSATISSVAIKASVRSSIVSHVFKVLVPITIALTPGNVTLAPAQTQGFTATVADSSNTGVAWSLNPAVGSISAVGLYTAPASIGNAQSIQVTATSAADPTKSASAGISLVPVAHVTLSVSTPGPLIFSATQGSISQVTQSIAINNGGNSPLHWSATSNASWLTFSAASNSLAADSSASLTLVVNPSGLGLGIHTATATITDSDSLVAPPQTVSVTLTVSSIIPGYPLLPTERTFPSDTGMVNVKTQFGAKGDGITDDTAAIQRAISQTIRHENGSILYFPTGTYLVSRPLIEKDLSGAWQSVLTFQGENQDSTIIKLTDNNPLYQSPGSPNDVLDMGSLEPLNSQNGGGNNGFDNYLFDISIDVGKGNPGSVALDFMGNNYCGLRNVTLSSSDPNHSGAIGLSLLRYATGPCMMKNLVINGFSYGIDASNLEYSATFEGVTLLNQSLYGIYNAGNILSIRGLVSTNRVTAIYNQSQYGLITLLQATLKGGAASIPAILNNGALYARSVTATGYHSVLQNKTTTIPGSSLTEYDSGPIQSLFSHTTSSLNLPIQETPQFEEPNLANWKSVLSYGADPTGASDSSSAVQAAIDSGATTVYFPIGKYLLTKTIFVRGSVRMIDGFDSWIEPTGMAFQNAGNVTPLFEVSAASADVTISHVRVGNWQHSYPGLIVVRQNSQRALAILNSAFNGSPVAAGYQNTTQGNGTLFLEDVSTSSPMQIETPQTVFARQLDPELNGTKVLNNGGSLWVLGLKTELAGTNIETDNGGSTELLGGLIYPVQNVPVNQSAFVISNSSVSLVYAVSSYSPPVASPSPDFQSQVTETRNSATRVLATTAVPSRGYGVIMPLYAP